MDDEKNLGIFKDELTDEERKVIDKAVKKVIEGYGETSRMLGETQKSKPVAFKR